MRTLALAVLLVLQASAVRASGHGPVFGAATPTLGRGGWSLDQAWTIRTDDGDDSAQMLKTMIAFGVTETFQLSASFPLAMSDGQLHSARMMSLMSSDRDFEALAGWRFQRRTIGIGGRQESTLYAGGTLPMESRRDGVETGPSVEVGIATGYAGRAHYVWVGGGVQSFVRGQLRDSALATVVYGYRPRPLRTEAGKPDLRFFVEMTAEGRRGALTAAPGAGSTRTVFVGPTTLLLHKAVGVEGGVLFPVYQQVSGGSARERMRVAVNVAYFFWLK